MKIMYSFIILFFICQSFSFSEDKMDNIICSTSEKINGVQVITRVSIVTDKYLSSKSIESIQNKACANIKNNS